MRLSPREVDTTALAFAANGRCTWPTCSRKLWTLEGGRYAYDAIKAHIQAAEENGPRWNSAMTDEQRRAPANLIWLCQAHHVFVDTEPEKYTVAVLTEWKLRREAEQPEMQRMEGLSEESLRELLNDSLDGLADRLDGISLPGIDVAEMLVTASLSMPSADVAETLSYAGDRMPGTDLAEALTYAVDRLPSEDTVGALCSAAERFSDKSWIAALKEQILELDRSAENIRRETINASSIRISVDTSGMTNDPLRWFAGGVMTSVVTLLIGIAIAIYAVNH